jgi:hypothetical protein
LPRKSFLLRCAFLIFLLASSVCFLPRFAAWAAATSSGRSGLPLRAAAIFSRRPRSRSGSRVYGTTLEAVIHEHFGDGIKSAIDFTLDVRKQEDPKATASSSPSTASSSLHEMVTAPDDREGSLLPIRRPCPRPVG